MDSIIYLTGSDGVRQDKTWQISSIRYDEQKGLYAIVFKNSPKTFYYRKNRVQIVNSLGIEKRAGNVLNYLKEISLLCDLKNDRGENILAKMYAQLGYIPDESALATYLDHYGHPTRRVKSDLPIFPFGCNNSQFKAVESALTHSISIIQGPPGTGKTQTILNIIANLVMQDKKVLVVSNNNSAIENVYEKLLSPDIGLGFMVAMLGKSENSAEFLEKQDGRYPARLKEWGQLYQRKNPAKEFDKICKASETLKELFEYEEKEAALKQELDSLLTEHWHFAHGVERTALKPTWRLRRLSSDRIMQLWLDAQNRLDEKRKLSWWFRLKLSLRYGIKLPKALAHGADELLRLYQELYYEKRAKELQAEIDEKESLRKGFKPKLAYAKALDYVHYCVARRYGDGEKRRVFDEKEIKSNSFGFYDEYPIVLSTTFSARRCLPHNSKEFLFDYVIMDEASQVDVATGALALSCARNAVIVGDEKQLPNVITTLDRQRAQAIFAGYSISAAYDFAKHSFLSSIMAVLPYAPNTLLREHYRCHPKIINFCNQKFYNDQLVIMTTDQGEKDVISLYTTNEGNHCRGHKNQRQVDVIKGEILPSLPEHCDVGIIAPYRDQAELLASSLPGLQADTVHKFQGREKDAIILSTTDDYITQFADDKNLLNVAISRAKARLCVVISGNRQPGNSNISDLVEYIKYNNCKVIASSTVSVFDYLYSQYALERWAHLRRTRRVSQYSSENLMYGLLCDILKDEQFGNLGIMFEYPLNMLVPRDKLDLIGEDERRYALNDCTHVDFLLYNKFSKAPVLAIEVDGYRYHREGTAQAARDKMKDRILATYGIKLLRFATNGSGEREQILSALSQLQGDGDEDFKGKER